MVHCILYTIRYMCHSGLYRSHLMKPIHTSSVHVEDKTYEPALSSKFYINRQTKPYKLMKKNVQTSYYMGDLYKPESELGRCVCIPFTAVSLTLVAMGCAIRDTVGLIVESKLRYDYVIKELFKNILER